MKTLAVSDDEFDALAGGDGDTAGALGAGRYSKRLLLLHELRTRGDGDGAKAFAVLSEAHRRARHAVDEVILDPHVGAWASACLGAMLVGQSHDLAHVGAVAAAAALKAGMDFEVVTWVGAEGVFLPTLGSIDLGGYEGRCQIRSGSGGDGVEIVTGETIVGVPRLVTDRDTGAWRPLRRIRSEAEGLVLDVAVDDIGPYRDCGELAVADRLDAAAFDDWRDKVTQAWTMLARDHREQARAIAAGVMTLVPLRATAAAAELSASCHVAGGAVAMTTPRQPLSAALALVHEFQHIKLSALLDLVPLLDHSPAKTLHAPWRDDPRPLRGLLQGTYAFLGLTRFWNVRRKLSEPPEPGVAPGWAEMEVALGRLQVAEALVTLGKSDDVLPLGRRFVDGMIRCLAEVEAELLPERPTHMAEMAARDHQASWRMRNLCPDPAQAKELAQAWSRRQSCRWPSELLYGVVDGGGPLASAARLSLFRQHVAFPDRRLDAAEGISPGDLALVEHGPTAARLRYEAQVVENPDDLASWSGLVATLDGDTALAMFPEWVLAVHRAIREHGDAAPGPETLAAWIARA